MLWTTGYTSSRIMKKIRNLLRIQGAWREDCSFLSQLTHSPEFTVMTPQDVCRFLVWSDQFGMTQVHTVSFHSKVKWVYLDVNVILYLQRELFQIWSNRWRRFRTYRRSRSWDAQSKIGNSCLSKEVKNDIKQCKEEQAKTHVLPKQAKPIFLGKNKINLSLREKFVLIRDQAIFKIQFFAGDRISDVCDILSQDVKKLQDNSGFVFN